MGGAISVEAKPANDTGYVFAISHEAAPWRAASPVSTRQESSSERGFFPKKKKKQECPPPGEEALRFDETKRTAPRRSPQWAKARYAVRGVAAFSSAGTERAVRRRSFSECTNGWIAREVSPLLVNKPGGRLRSMQQLEVGRVVGRGGFAEVRLARLKKDQTYVALKRMSKSRIARHGHERHVDSERRVLLALRGQSPFVVTLFATFHDEESLYLVMEFVPGGELFSKVRDKSCLAVEPAKFYLAEILSALSFVHARGFAYRDLKPENVLLDTDGHCRLVDFGFACAPPDDGLMMTNVGTPAYMSPEQLCRKRTGGYTRVVDYWAFGCVAFELVSGRAPFSSKHHADDEPHYAIYQRVMRGKVNFPKFVLGPTKLLILSLLRRSLDKRLASADAIRAHIFFEAVDFKAVEERRAIPPDAVGTLPVGDTSSFFPDGDDRGKHRTANPSSDSVRATTLSFSGF